jgi:hypothetical protein
MDPQRITLKVSKAEADHWASLSGEAQDAYEGRAHFLIEKGYVQPNVDAYSLAIKSAYKLKDAPAPEGLVYADGSSPRRPEG